MKTEDLIAALAADDRRLISPGRLFIWLGLLAAVLVLAFFFTVVGLRPDVLHYLFQPLTMPKFIVPLMTGLLALPLTMALSRPEARVHLGLLLLPAGALILAVMAGLLTSAPSDWPRLILGQHAAFCMTMIPLMATPLLAALLIALRRGAGTRPRLEGALAGLCAGALSASLYAWHCPVDSPLYFSTWYTLATLLVTLAGAWLGPRLLRW